eukprot:356057-Chlamydomonas_euryale.AAC.3
MSGWAAACPPDACVKIGGRARPDICILKLSRGRPSLERPGLCSSCLSLKLLSASTGVAHAYTTPVAHPAPLTRCSQPSAQQCPSPSCCHHQLWRRTDDWGTWPKASSVQRVSLGIQRVPLSPSLPPMYSARQTPHVHAPAGGCGVGHDPSGVPKPVKSTLPFWPPITAAPARVGTWRPPWPGGGGGRVEPAQERVKRQARTRSRGTEFSERGPSASSAHRVVIPSRVGTVAPRGGLARPLRLPGRLGRSGRAGGREGGRQREEWKPVVAA